MEQPRPPSEAAGLGWKAQARADWEAGEFSPMGSEMPAEVAANAAAEVEEERAEVERPVDRKGRLRKAACVPPHGPGPSPGTARAPLIGEL